MHLGGGGNEVRIYVKRCEIIIRATKVKITEKSSTRDSSCNFIFGDTVSILECQLSGVIEYSSLLLCGVRMKTCRCCVDCRSEYTSLPPSTATVLTPLPSTGSEAS